MTDAAGREMDAEIAVEVMGWTQHQHMLDCWCIDGVLGFRQKHYFCPSTDIAAAFEVQARVATLARYMGKIVPHVIETDNSRTVQGLCLKERYCYELILLVTGCKAFETTTMGENNHFRKMFQSDDWYAIINATPEQRCKAALACVRGRGGESK